MKISMILFYIYTLICSINVWAEFSIDHGFNPTLCKNGYASRWAGSCVCDIPNQWGGKYCSDPLLNECQSNLDCPQKSFCVWYQEKGRCLKNQVRNILDLPEAIYALSDGLISYQNAGAFCSSLGSNFRPIARKDFHCASQGASCLDKELILAMQGIFGMRGFFWLDAKVGTNEAYYADLNDGVVYSVAQDNIKSNQVLCIKDKK